MKRCVRAILIVVSVLALETEVFSADRPAAKSADAITLVPEALALQGLHRSYGETELLNEQQMLTRVNFGLPEARIPRYSDDFNREDEPDLGGLWRTTQK